MTSEDMESSISRGDNEDESQSSSEKDVAKAKKGKGKKKKSIKVNTQTSPNSVIKAILLLSKPGHEKVKEKGFECFLYLSLVDLKEREILRFLMDHTHVVTEQTSDGESSSRLEIRLTNKTIPIDENVVAHTLGVPAGDGESFDTAVETATIQQARIMLGLPENVIKEEEDVPLHFLQDEKTEDEETEDEEKKKEKEKRRKDKWDAIRGQIKVDYIYHVMKQAKESNDVELEVKCFFFIIFHTLVIPSTNFYLDNQQMKAGSEIDNIQKINWRKACLEQMIQGVNSWQVRRKKKSEKQQAENIRGPVLVLLLCYLDYLKSKKVKVDASVTPRICYYKSEMLKKLIDECKQPGGKKFDKLEFKEKEDTCYSKEYDDCDKVEALAADVHVQKNERLRLNRGIKQKGGRKAKKYVNRDCEENSGGENTMVVRIERELNDFSKSSLKNFPRMLHNNMIQTVEETHSTIVETYDNMSSTLESLMNKYDKFYSDRILSRAKWTKEQFTGKGAVGLYGVHVSEFSFVQSLAPGGWLGNFLVDAQCSIWRHQEEWKDSCILSQAVVNKLLGMDVSAPLSNEIERADLLDRVKKIFVPVLFRDSDGQGIHWALLVMHFDDKKWYIIDTLQSPAYVKKMDDVISALRTDLEDLSIDCSSFKTERLQVDSQTNGSDCGFYMLMYMERFDERELNLNADDVSMYRKKLAMDLCEHPANIPEDFSNNDEEGYYTMDGSTICIHTPVQSHTELDCDVPLSDLLGNSKKQKKKNVKRSSRNATDKQGQRKRQKTISDMTTSSEEKRNLRPADTPRPNNGPKINKIKCAVYDLVCSEGSKFEQQPLFNIQGSLSILCGHELAQLFSESGHVNKEIMDAFIALKNADQKTEKTVVCLSTRTAFNFDQDEFTQELGKRTNKLSSAKMIFLPILSEHWYIYSFNVATNQLEYLCCDSDEAAWDIAKKECSRVITAIREARTFFRKGPTVIRKQSLPYRFNSDNGDSGLFAMYFMSEYTGKDNKSFSTLDKLGLSEYRALVMQYLLLHAMNYVWLPKEFARRPSEGQFQKMKFVEGIIESIPLPAKWHTDPSREIKTLLPIMKDLKDKDNEFGGTVFMLQKDRVCQETKALEISLSGNDILNSFGPAMRCEDAFILYFSLCLMNDYDIFKSERGIILPPKIVRCLVYTRDGTATEPGFSEEAVVESLKSLYRAEQFEKASFIYLPLKYGDHWVLYVFNMIHEQMDILDSSCSSIGDKRKFHKELSGKIRGRLYMVLTKFTKIKDFHKYGPVLVNVPSQKPSSNDCGFFVMMFLERYDPYTRKVHYAKNEDSDNLRSRVLYYLISHKINEAERPFNKQIEDLCNDNETQ